MLRIFDVGGCLMTAAVTWSHTNAGKPSGSSGEVAFPGTAFQEKFLCKGSPGSRPTLFLCNLCTTDAASARVVPFVWCLQFEQRCVARC